MRDLPGQYRSKLSEIVTTSQTKEARKEVEEQNTMRLYFLLCYYRSDNKERNEDRNRKIYQDPDYKLVMAVFKERDKQYVQSKP